ncbi:Flavo-diiron protein FprA1 [bioreactor metagenome]|uniref:Flavo-diiron protein FprA1 n=1 Tax=bioreactor metagenome TaxID=1076179 RepID=A0A645IMJ4_9ZZZZ
MVTSDREAVLARMLLADGILFGTPTMVAEALKPIWDLTTSISSVIYKDKLMSAFGSYGWSGEGVLHIVERLRQLKAEVPDGFRVRFKPTEAELQAAYEFGSQFVLRLKEK